MSFVEYAPPEIRERIESGELVETDPLEEQPIPEAEEAPSTSAAILCELCGEPVTTTRNAYRRVSGWEKPRKRGGTNAIVLRKPTDEWAHDRCIDLAKQGRLGQESIL